MTVTMFIMIGLVAIAVMLFAVRTENNRIDAEKRCKGLEARIRLLEQKQHTHPKMEEVKG